jgi:hypothetical protein
VAKLISPLQSSKQVDLVVTEKTVKIVISHTLVEFVVIVRHRTSPQIVVFGRIVTTAQRGILGCTATCATAPTKIITASAAKIGIIGLSLFRCWLEPQPPTLTTRKIPTGVKERFILSLKQNLTTRSRGISRIFRTIAPSLKFSCDPLIRQNHHNRQFPINYHLTRITVTTHTTSPEGVLFRSFLPAPRHPLTLNTTLPEKRVK